MKRFDNIDSKLESLSNLQSSVNDYEEPMDNEDVQRLLKISERTLQRYKQQKLLPYSKIKGKSYYKKSDVLEVIRQKGR